MSDVVRLLGWLCVALVSAPIVHELGHAAAAWMVSAKHVRITWVSPLVLCTRAEFADDVKGSVREAQWRFVLGGPLANVCVAGLCAATCSSVGLVCAFVHAGLAATTLWPSGGSDGAQLLALLRTRRAQPIVVDDNDVG